MQLVTAGKEMPIYPSEVVSWNIALILLEFLPSPNHPTAMNTTLKHSRDCLVGNPFKPPQMIEQLRGQKSIWGGFVRWHI